MVVVAVMRQLCACCYCGVAGFSWVFSVVIVFYLTCFFVFLFIYCLSTGACWSWPAFKGLEERLLPRCCSRGLSPEINLDTRVVLQVTEELRPLSSLPWCPRCPREMLTCCCTTAEGPESAHRHPPLHCQQIQLAATYSCRRMAACWLSSTTSSTCWCKMPSSCGEKSTRNEWRASDTSVVFLKMLFKALVVLLICVMDCVPSASTAWKMVNQVQVSLCFLYHWQ